MKFRKLEAGEIEVRVGSINEKGATLLLYKDARADMRVLDESNVKWKRSHELINGNLFCTVSVWDEDIKEWVSRQDVGVESNAEKEKGQASDAFKRACFNWGIGRELYTAPFIWIGADRYNGFVRGKTKDGKNIYSTYDKFSVTNISYTGDTITNLEIKNDKTGSVVFTFGGKVESPKAPTPAPKPAQESKPTQEQLDTIYTLAVAQGKSDDDIRTAMAKITTAKLAEATITKMSASSVTIAEGERH